MSNWWALPGPGAFIGAVQDSLERGENVVLRLPKGTPAGIKGRIELGLEAVAWRDVQAECGCDPIVTLFDEFIGDPSASLRRTPGELVKQEQFEGHVIWLSGLDDKTWRSWRAFLRVYQHEMRDVPIVRRTTFIIPLAGSHATLDVDTDVGTAEFAWGQDYDRHDLLFLATKLLERRRLPVLHRRLCVALVAELALWDEELAQQLASDGQHVLMDPSAILDQIREERGWGSGEHDEHDVQSLWAAGQAAKVDGQFVRHLASLPDALRQREVKRRIWRAQLTTCMPFIEEVRQGAVATYGRLLAPIIQGTSRQHGLFDLEIAQVAQQLQSQAEVPVQHRRLFNVLHRVRNRMAHLDIVDWGDIPGEYPANLGLDDDYR